MIELTVKTLDSQNHQFSVEDDMTVGQFKDHIADKVTIPAATQRIIYCGRVLQDNDKLSDYDVNGKVVHLVQRAPPSTNQRGNQGGSSTSENANHNRAGGGGGGGGFMGFDRVGNAVYLGSMAFGNEPHIPQRATHNLSASRLSLARRMLRGAAHAINHLENPNDTNDQSPPGEANAEEEMTPVIEARVIVPNNSDQPMDENAVLSAVENSLFGDASSTMQVDSSPEASQNQSSENNASSPSDSATNDATSSQPQGAPSESSQQPNNGNNGGGRNPRIRTVRGLEMAELLTALNQLQARFAPFLARYQSFFQDDPQVAPENVESTRRMLRLVSQTMHYLSHAYHSFSDIMINVEQPPPRLLMCRPILIQQSAMVHAGIPFQLEAEINVSADPPPNSTNGSTTPRGTAGSTPSTAAAPTSGANGQGQTRTIPTSIPNANINITQGPSTNMEFIGLPFMPAGGSMRVITTPIEIRAVRSNGNTARARPPNNNNNSAQDQPATTAGPGTATPHSTTEAPTDAAQPQNQQQPQGPPQGPQPTAAGPFGPNMEFVVEVTPEVFRGAMNGPPPEFIQSLMQLVNSQLFNRPPQQQNQQQPDGQRTVGTPPSSTDASGQPVQAPGTPGQNSQARGRNTQTNPTTSTHTRSTSRPHIQMTQQAVQGGFDPYLPCYSHHVVHHRHRLGNLVAAASPQEMGPPGQQRTGHHHSRSSPASSNTSTRETPTLQSLFGNLVNDTQNLDELMHVSRAAENLVAMLTNSAPPRPQPTTTDGEQQQPNSQSTRRSSDPNPISSFPPASFLSSMFRGNGGDLNIGVTLDQLLSSLNQEESYTPGDSLIMDLLMLLLRNLRITDLFLLNSGNLAPLNQNRAVIQEFFRRDVCGNDLTPQGVERASERVLSDMQNVVNGFAIVPTRDNIDLIRSIEALLRHHIPQVINMAVNLNNDDVRPLVDRCWAAGRQLLALVLHCAVNGRQDLEHVMEEIMTRSMTDIPIDVQVWTNANSRVAINSVIRNLNVPAADLQQFIVLQSEENAKNEGEEKSNKKEQSSTSGGENVTNGLEEMDVDSSDSSRAEANHIDTRLMEDTEPLPNVVFGSESWHRQTNEDWVPIITRDVYKQRRQNSQPPFSDAYLSGMPSKRRKLINGSKSQSSLPEVVKDSLRQAVTSVGVASTVALDSVVAAAGSSTEILTAYRTMVHSTVQENLKENEDFTSEQFPNASSYFSKSID